RRHRRALHAAAGRAAADRDRGAVAVLAVIGDLASGFGDALAPTNLLLGVLPGIGPALTIALLLPLTFNFSDPTGAFIMFAGIYAGGMYGGSTTSILL